MNTIRFTVNAGEDGMSIKQFLRDELSFSMHQISRVKYRSPGFLVNGRPQWVNFVLHEGDELVFALDEEAGAGTAVSGAGTVLSEAGADVGSVGDAEGALRILYEDPYLLIADKPAGMVSHPSHGHWEDSALSLLEKGRGRLYLTGRLDKDTSGVLLFARQKETASVLAAKRKAGQIRKIYLARIEGRMDPSQGTIAIPIGEACSKPLKMKADPAGGKEAATHYETLRAGEANSLVKVEIDQGRTHQIRVHFSAMGHPLVGDALYGHAAEDGRAPGGAQLHAWKIELRHPFTGEKVSAEAELPGWV